MDDFDRLQAHLQDAGCDAHTISQAERLYEAGDWTELNRCLRLCRSEQLEALHVRQRQLDRLDLLIRQTQDRM